MKTLTDYQKCPNCGALNPPDVEYCAKCRMVLSGTALGFFKPINRSHNTICAQARISGRLVLSRDSKVIQGMIESRIVEEISRKLVEDKVVKIEQYYDPADDSMVYTGYLNLK